MNLNFLTNHSGQMKYSLYTILAFIVVTTVVTIMAVNSLIAYRSTKNWMIQETKLHSNRSLNSLTKNVANLIESYSINEYEKLVLSEMDQKEFHAIIVRDYNMGKILGQESYVTGKIKNADGRIIDFSPVDQDVNRLINQCFLSVTSPMTSASGAALGEITICSSDQAVKQVLGRTIKANLLNTVILSAVLILLLFFAIQHFVLKPVSKIVETLNKTDISGIPEEEITAHGAVEISNLSTSLQHMIQTVKNSRRELKKHQEDLERRVEERTAELKGINENLQQEIMERKQAEKNLADAKKEADAANQAKSMFLANMSHEIRTPMNAVLGMNRLALESSKDPEQRRHLKAALQSAEALLTIINDILDFSKIEAGQMELNEVHFELKSILKTVVQTFAIKAQEKGLDMTYHLAPGLKTQLLGDEYRLRQILFNLVGNAMKFTESGEINIDVQSAPHKDADIVLQFCVKDSGIGIPAEALDDIFSRFNQADNTITRKFGGTGLGLAICQKLSDLMGGEIWVESELGRGTSFYFTTRFRPGDPARIQSKAETTTARILLPHMRILLVEDNRLNRDLARIILEKEGHTVDVATNGLEALERLASNSFDVILMDIQMPELDGINTTKFIRACEEQTPIANAEHQDLLYRVQDKLRGKTMPIIAMTAHAMADHCRVCIESGMDGYITKPFEPQELFRTIAQVTGVKTVPQTEIDLSADTQNEPKHASDKPDLFEKTKAHLMTKYKISPEMATTVITTGMQSLNEELDQAENAFRKKDFELLKRSAHSMKGALRYMGLDTLATLAQRIEHRQTRVEEDPAQGLERQLKALRQGLTGFENEAS